MSLNRIFQGRISSFALQNDQGEFDELSNFAAETSPLFQHHRVFQDAVNYYLLAIVALADRNKDTPLAQLASRMEEVWSPFVKRNHHFSGLLASLAPWLELDSKATLPDAFNKILADNPADKELLNLAAASLLLDLGGDSAIQQGGRTYFPLLCDPKSSANFPRGSVNRLKSKGKAILASILWAHDIDNKSPELGKKLHYDYFANPTTDGKKIEGKFARRKLTEALAHEHATLVLPPQLKIELELSIQQLPEDYSFPNYTGGSVNKDALKRRFFLYLLTAHVSPDPKLYQRLRDTFQQPTTLVSEYIPKEAELPFLKLDDDPIKLARCKRGYVFPAFTALPLWTDVKGRRATWKEFDIAAFKEALKTINQFKAKTAERKARMAVLATSIDYIKGATSKKPKITDEETDEVPIHTFKKDARYPLLTKLRTDLGITDEEEEFHERGISRSGIRGFRDIRKQWDALFKEGRPNPSETLLVDIAQQYQKDNSRSIGDATLFQKLAQAEFHILWRNPCEKEKIERIRSNHAVDVFSAYITLADFESELKRCADPIKFTPADPIHSRRLFMFSDMTGSTKAKIDLEKGEIALSIVCQQQGTWLTRKARLTFSAPRLKRDGLIARSNAPWLPPVMGGLELDSQYAVMDKIALSYMPTTRADGGITHLLNFPVTFDESALLEAIGKKAIWDGNFNGTKNTKLHLLWPSISEAKGKKSLSWWKNSTVIAQGFQVMGVDLGQRAAAACSILDIRCDNRFHKNQKPFTLVGRTDGHDWKASLRAQFTLKLPGEGMSILGENGKFSKEPGGNRGRKSTESEWQEACAAAAVFIDEPSSWLGKSFKQLTYPEQNDKLVKILRRSNSRYRSLFRASWMLDTDLETALEIVKSFPSATNLTGLAESKNIGKLKISLQEQLESLSTGVINFIEIIANRILPQRDYIWEWAPHSSSSFGDDGWHELKRKPSKIHPKINPQRQRGISMARIEQLDIFRRTLLSFNRSQQEKFGVKPTSGAARREQPTPEVCPEILGKINNIKTQRVNQTAHMILAQALGVKLTSNKTSKAERRDHDIHGEYEAITGRAPVDFIVLEDLRRYTMSSDRPPFENGRLMKWCHSAITDKVKELCEPYGITVLETFPAYTSKFHSVLHCAGFRARQITRTDACSSYAMMLAEKVKLTPIETLKNSLFAKLREAANKNIFMPGLWLPENGGPYFIGLMKTQDGYRPTPPHHADLNASVNIALNAIAAPDSTHLLRKIRAEHKAGKPVLVKSNKREKAAFGNNPDITFATKPEAAFIAKNRFNIFADMGKLATFDSITIEGITEPLATARGLFKAVKNEKWAVCEGLNHNILKNAGLAPNSLHIDPDDDQIPM
ncbi:MAG: type V CRISPR-associated protein Cas12b [Verrucomicrobiota bacterium]